MSVELSWTTRVNHQLPAASMREALQKVAHMNLVGFVIASERVHYQIDTAAQRELVLALAARHQRVEAVAVGVAGPARRLAVMIGEKLSPDPFFFDRRSRTNANIAVGSARPVRVSGRGVTETLQARCYHREDFGWQCRVFFRLF